MQVLQFKSEFPCVCYVQLRYISRIHGQKVKNANNHTTFVILWEWEGRRVSWTWKYKLLMRNVILGCLIKYSLLYSVNREFCGEDIHNYFTRIQP